MKWVKLTKPMMTGPEVTRLQEILIYLGFDIGPTGIDGVYGPETSKAVKTFQLEHGLIADGAVGNLETWPLILDILKVKALKSQSTETKIHFIDRMGLHDPPANYDPDLSPRPWSGDGENVINGVVLHQTGSVLSGDTRMYDSGNYHIEVLQSGNIILVNPLEWYINHANELSGTTIGIEFQGNMLGVHGDPSTVWNDGSVVNDLTIEQLKASEYLFAWLRHRFEANGGKFEYVYAHRQSSKERRADPGSEIWTKIGLQWIEWLGASDGGPGFTIGDGMPIPKQWNPAYDADY